MRPSADHPPPFPAVLFASSGNVASGTGSPPAAGTFQRRSPSMKAIQLPSGDQNGRRRWENPASSRGASWSRERTQRRPLWR